MKPVRHDAIAWFEIPVLDLPRATAFYETVLDITLSSFDVPEGGPAMMMFPQTSGISGALCCLPGFYTPSHTGALIYLNANPDVQTALDKVVAAGGKVMVPKTLVTEEYGHMAVIEDSEGNRIALHSVTEKWFKEN
jgi:uncharacterized protein